MALKFLNKKGWHTGSLRNIENVWKAEQKHDAEQKKLEELRKQIQEERERSEFRLLQEQAGLVPRQERLDFLYESGLAVGKSSEGFKELAAPPSGPAPPPSEPSSSKAAVPGALFEKDKPQSANDAWRKLHSDPLLLIRQREKEALDRIKNNPVKMAMIKKSVEDEKEHKRDKKDKQEKKERKRKHKSKHDYRSSKVSSDSEERSEDEKETRKREPAKSEQHRHKSKREKNSSDVRSDSEDASKGERSKRDFLKHSSRARSDLKHTGGGEDYRRKGNHSKSDHHREERRKSDHSASELGLENKRNGTQSQDMRQGYGDNRPRGVPKLSEEERAARLREMQADAEEEDYRRKGNHSKSDHHGEERRKSDHSASELGLENKQNGTQSQDMRQGYGYNRPRGVPKLSEEERAARLREMQADAELHEEQRWKRLKKAAEADAREEIRARASGGKNFLDDAHKSIYGTEKGGSSTIEESVRRRAYFSQGGSASHESNAFRR